MDISQFQNVDTQAWCLHRKESNMSGWLFWNGGRNESGSEISLEELMDALAREFEKETERRIREDGVIGGEKI